MHCIKAKQSNPVGIIEFQKPVNELEAASLPPVRNPIGGPSYTTINIYGMYKSAPGRLSGCYFSL